MRICCDDLRALAKFSDGKITIGIIRPSGIVRDIAIDYCPFCGWWMSENGPKPVPGMADGARALRQKFRESRAALGKCHQIIDKMLGFLETIPDREEASGE